MPTSFFSRFDCVAILPAREANDMDILTGCFVRQRGKWLAERLAKHQSL